MEEAQYDASEPSSDTGSDTSVSEKKVGMELTDNADYTLGTTSKSRRQDTPLNVTRLEGRGMLLDSTQEKKAAMGWENHTREDLEEG